MRITLEALDGSLQIRAGEVDARIIQVEAGKRVVLWGTDPHIRHLSVRVAADSSGEQPVAGLAAAEHAAAALPPWWTRRGLQARLGTITLASLLFAASLLLYFGIRLVKLADYPIFFFSDEAVQTLLAADFLRDNFQNEQGTFFPTYFKNGENFNLSLSVYAQVIPYVLLGKSIFVTRSVPVLLSGIAAIAVGLTLRDIFKLPYWWAATLLLSLTPAWFLHTRTAFETVLAAAFYAAFIYFYLLYRSRSARFLYHALIFGALAFYSYSPAQVIVVLSGALLLVSDLPYHWRNREWGWRGLGLLALLALPYLRFRLAYPSAVEDHLRNLGSYWIEPIPLQDKLARFRDEYLYGLGLGYWYLPNNRDLPRHVMLGYGHILRYTLPFALLGFAIAVRNVREPAYRTILIAWIAAPVSGALVLMGVTRALVFVIPAALLTAIGLSRVLSWLQARGASYRILSVSAFFVLAVGNLWMTGDALSNGALWHDDYGLGGMQYGARQLFTRVQDLLEESPRTHIILSPNWANGTTDLARFFLKDPLPIQLASIDSWMYELKPLGPNTLFIMPREEFALMQASGKFNLLSEEDPLLYPDNEPGFHFVRLEYTENIEAVLEQERRARRVLREAQITIDGDLVQLRYPMLDMGQPAELVDGNEHTLIRTLEANPAVLEFAFPQPRSFSGLDVIIGSTEARITVELYPAGDGEPAVFSEVLKGVFEAPRVSLDFGETVTASVVRVEVQDIHQGEPAHIHIWEIRFR